MFWVLGERGVRGKKQELKREGERMWWLTQKTERVMEEGDKGYRVGQAGKVIWNWSVERRTKSPTNSTSCLGP